MRIVTAIALFIVYASAASELTLIFWYDESLKTKKEKSYNDSAPPQENEVAAADTALTAQADIDNMTQPLSAALLAIYYYFTNDLKLKITQDDFEAKIKESLE